MKPRYQKVPDNAPIEKFVVRLPPGLRDELQAMAERNRRSMNSELILAIEARVRENRA